MRPPCRFNEREIQENHKRLMLLNPLIFFGVAALFMVAGAAYDAWSRGRVHPAYVWGGALFVLSVPLRLALSGTSAWLAFDDWLVR
jgi:hypothetical protein